MNDAYETLFPTRGGFNGADYLVFLEQRVPKDLAEQLTHDAHPDLWLDEYVEVADMIRALSSHSFPADCDCQSTGGFRLAGVLEHTVIGYFLHVSSDAKSHDPYKQIYISSLYLYCCMHGAQRSRFYIDALLVLASAARQIPFEGRLQVSRFIGSLVPLLPQASIADPTPFSSALLALSLITANTLDDLSLLVEHSINEEGFAAAWRKEEEESKEGYPPLDSMRALRRSVWECLGRSGKLSKIAERFVAVEDLTDKTTRKDKGDTPNV